MAERKSALKRAPERPDLLARLEAAKAMTISDEQLTQQKASFIYGNAPSRSGITKASALKATTGIRLSRD